MTTEALERALRTIAEPQEDDVRLQRSIRHQLEGQLHAGAPRRRTMRFTVGSVAAVAALAAVLVVALIGTGGSAGPGPAVAEAAIIRHAAQAMTSAGSMIVHVKETGVQNGTPVSVEWWQATRPPYAMRMIKGAGANLHEGADDGSTSFQYDAGTNTLDKRPDGSRSLGLVDPLEIVRHQLAQGHAKVAGTVTIDGASLYKIELPRGVVGYFDTTNYRPRYVDNPQGDGSVVRTRVDTYEELPMSAENEKLLSITAQHPDARVQTTSPPTK